MARCHAGREMDPTGESCSPTIGGILNFSTHPHANLRLPHQTAPIPFKTTATLKSFVINGTNRNRPVTTVFPSESESGSSSEFSVLGDLRCDIPRQKVVEFADSVVGNPLDDETQISFRVEIVEFR